MITEDKRFIEIQAILAFSNINIENCTKINDLIIELSKERNQFKEYTNHNYDKAKQLQQENKILKENAENNDKVVDKVNWENQLLKKENKQLKDNWNYIKKMLKEARQEKFNINGYCGTCTDVDIDFLLNKMQELEGSGDK